jgi:hypothetical protein
VTSLVDDWALIVASMRSFLGLNGHLRISAKFEVPPSPPWPRLAWGLKLGVRVAAIRSAGRYVKDHPERKRSLDELG